MGTYNVTFIFDYARIGATVEARSEEAAPDKAASVIYWDLGFSELSSFLDSAREVMVEVVE